MTTKFGLSSDVCHKICQVFTQHPEIEVATLYGSRAKGNFKNGSDIDLTLQGANDLTMDVLYQVMGELDELSLPYTIDLSLYHSVTNPDLIAHVKRVGVEFYRKKAISLVDLPKLSTMVAGKGFGLTKMDEELYQV